MARAVALVRRASPVSPEERDEIRALLAEVEGDPRPWLSDDDFTSKLAGLRPTAVDD